MITAPHADQVEISLFGPGYGECCLIHIGSGKWIVVDSCIEQRRQTPIALEYLSQMGFDPASAVVMLVATHWHDDHVRGISSVLKSCSSASFVVPTAMSSKEFIAMAVARNSIASTKVSSGTKEIVEVFRHLNTSGRPAMRAIADRSLLTIDRKDLAHGHGCTITSLSPSDKQIQLFMDDLSFLVPNITESETRCIARSPNNLAIALWVSLGPIHLLLGADLEETRDPLTGWSVVVASTSRPAGQASVFKVPHHGSQNGHCDSVWSQMLIHKPISILTPYIRGGLALPNKEDVERIVAHSGSAFSTAQSRKPKTAKKLDPVAFRMLRQGNINITLAEPPIGQVCLRNGGASDFTTWTTKLDGSAFALG